MKEFSISMALVDFIPVILFLMGSVILMKKLHSKMQATSFALFSTGLINVFIAGFLKATYKLLYAANICDFEALNTMFFPVQSIGFLLAGIGLISTVIKNKNIVLSAAPAFYKGTFLFVGLMILGLGLLDTGLCIIASKSKKKAAIPLFILSFVFSLCMGYLSSRDFTQASMNWIAQFINIAGQGCFLGGALMLKKEK